MKGTVFYADGRREENELPTDSYKRLSALKEAVGRWTEYLQPYSPSCLCCKASAPPEHQERIFKRFYCVEAPRFQLGERSRWVLASACSLIAAGIEEVQVS